ncbi:glucosamine--fructose-6-phosphate aminotransferase [Fistulifera solaris]|uniref:Glutamine--fructose-6-phosphate aminotransferase [isomerizing] n=1 Tax=Fistulifera solaris TaxID=1519565 RepID=A0A1Z5K0J1_FISSO|nr:glucosamine--fructose-6-phosphate aminotransferase [Fistulifera solaris]|eukprot:GAX19814.1 glucosamine--fructose-6-phosphate aminotransferase [Fistulifera solaris]
MLRHILTKRSGTTPLFSSRWMAVAAVTAGYSLQNEDELISYFQAKKAYCCGLVGVIGSENYSSRDFLLNGLSLLKNRGFDSAGIATMDAQGEHMTITKFASVDHGMNSIELVQTQHPTSVDSMGIAHTRWATQGARTNENAHPHTDAAGRIAVVHNGNINNYDALRKELIEVHKISLQGQTDSEVLAKLIGHYYNGDNLKQAVEKALSRCDGTWGLVVMSQTQPDQLIVACHGSPMVIGVDDRRMYVASEAEAFAGLTKTVVHMEDGEIATLYADGRSLDFSRVEQVADDDEEEEQRASSPEPYPHWTLKELSEAPQAAARALGFGGRLGADRVYLGGLDDQVESLKQIRHLVLAGVATSLHAAKYGELLMKRLGSVTSVAALDAAECESKDFPVSEDLRETGLVVISQSGETKDGVSLVQMAKGLNIPTMSVVNAVGSTIARATKLGVYCNAGRENAVASTKAFTSQVTVLSLIALWFQQNRPNRKKQHLVEAEQLKESLMRLPMSFGAALQTHEQCKSIARKLKGKEHCFVLGKGFGEPVAQEGALKLKEFSYIHAEGYSGGSLIHGPFALLQSDLTGKQGATPVIMIILDDDHAQEMRMAAEVVKARGAQIHIITDNAALAEDLDDDPIVIPNNGYLTALAATIPLTLIAYELALIKGLNPDTPRNLAKALLVS